MENKEQFEAKYLDKFEYPKESTLGKIQTYGDFEKGDIYDVYKLIDIAETLPEESVSVDALAEGVFYNKTWHDVRGKDISPSDVAKVVEESKAEKNGTIDWDGVAEANPDLAYHIRKLEQINYDTPILLFGESTIVDGVHRVLKAWLEGAKEIKAKRFEELPESARLSPELYGELSGGGRS